MMKYHTHKFSSVTIFALLLVFLISCNSEKKEGRKSLTVVFYNVENLFDLKDEPGKSDEEFTPESKKQWTQERFDKKVNDIARVLSSINSVEFPGIIGLCEVENEFVLDALVKTDSLAKGNYRVVHYESPDFRGIDNALLYRPDEFSVLYSEPIHVSFSDEPDYVTRDILYVKGKTSDGEVFHIFINHWPSRIGGAQQTEPKRMHVASILRSKVDSLKEADKNPEIIIMGDMNDEPANNSLAETLGAKDPATNPDAFLQNLMFEVDKKDLGSYSYRGNWNMLDNLIVSKNLLDEKGFRCDEKEGYVFHKSWMEYRNNEGEISPNRTYGGPNYYGGISDHFPVYFELKR